ncbi:unnamed protein product [Rotaria sordida]|uniref:DUF3824 domain-containing protein n=1 Tax=Rotaria sordida TaxID=392033 RepID=A0A815KBC7_9BILA|nr:unnamed protein product [Rotaria sordida]CAF1393404.1 unnamed protein product [Rotaria sordida]CAF1621253.1 unnamed protein product [Rotaria sordida]CAF3597696.1 unnamed protein product [Rotaria sordida]CAF4059555.1 unnamed protein product [Rotaria sordida]
MPLLLAAGAAGLAAYAIAKHKERRKSENEFMAYDNNEHGPPQHGNLYYGNIAPYYQPPSYYNYHNGFYYNTRLH